MKRNPLNYAICPGCGTIFSRKGLRANMRLRGNPGWFACLTCNYEVCDPPLRLLTIAEMLRAKGEPQRARYEGYRDVDLVRYTKVLVGLLDEETRTLLEKQETRLRKENGV